MIGELVSLSHVSKPHKLFIIVFVCCRLGSSLSVELDLRFGMHRYQVLLTTDRSEYPKYQADSGRYVLPIASEEVLSGPEVTIRAIRDLPFKDKGKLPIVGATSEMGLGRVKLRSHLVNMFGNELPGDLVFRKLLDGVEEGVLASIATPAAVEPSSRVDGDALCQDGSSAVVKQSSYTGEGSSHPRLLVQGTNGHTFVGRGAVGNKNAMSSSQMETGGIGALGSRQRHVTC